MDKIINELNNYGFSIIDDFLNDKLSDTIHELYNLNQEWVFDHQNRNEHYTHVFRTENVFLPDIDESYSAKFSRSKSLESNPKIIEIYDNNFIPFLREIDDTLNDFNFRCYKLDKGDYYRTHTDDYTSKINLIYYVNKRWCWDWGGILNISSSNDLEYNKQIFPKFNRVVLIQNEIFRSPHFVNQVHDYALSPRFSLVSFNK